MTPEDKLPVLAPSHPTSNTAPPDGGGWEGVAAGAVSPPDLNRRILSLHLPHFAIERHIRRLDQRGERPPESLPMALAIEGPHGRIIHATNRAAEAEGVHKGARAVDMRALCPELKLEYADIGGDHAALQKLMLWSRRWCPWTAVDGATGLVMDTTGAAHLWGGEAQMLRDIEGRLATLGLTASLAIAPTHGAAWALARFGKLRDCCGPDNLALRLSNMPTRALRLHADTLLLLKRLGLKTVGDLAAVPRLALARRFGRAPLAENPLLRLDQMLGHRPEPVSPPEDPPRFMVEARLAEPVQDPTAHIPELCTRLCQQLAGPGLGARKLRLVIYRSDGEVRHVDAATSAATRDAAHLTRLFDGKLDAIDPGFGFDLITLAALQAEQLTTAQAALDGRAGPGADLAHLIDRLSGRFGRDRLRRPSLRESHIPERREIWTPAMAGQPRPPLSSRSLRPLRLFDPPEEVRVIYAVPEGPPAQFIWRKITHRVVRFAGPERIAPEWWADRPSSRLRDYYRVEDQHGLRLWLYREGILDDGHRDDPRWCIHGAFD